MLEEVTSIDLGETQSITYKIHPSVIVSILNGYYKNTKKSALIGILRGKIYPDYVSITNMIFVPYSESKDGGFEVSIDPILKILDLSAGLFNETKVGWFITKPKPDLGVIGLHKHMSKYIKNPTNAFSGPLCLLVDLTLESNKIGVSGFTNLPNKFYKDSFAVFQPVSVTIDLPTEGNPSINSLLYDGLDPEREFNKPGSKTSDYDNYVELLTERIQNLKRVLTDLGDDALKLSPSLQRQLSNLLHLRLAVNTGNEAQMAARFKESNMMIKYHATLVETQLLLTEKLNANIKVK